MKHFFIRPIDTLFHRNAMPFDAALDSEAEGIFPTPPRTLYGAMRAWGFANKNVDFQSFSLPHDVHKVLGDKDSYGDLRLLGPVICMRQRYHSDSYLFYLPFPADVACQKDGGAMADCVRLSPKMIISDEGNSYYTRNDEIFEVEYPAEYTLSASQGLRWYLSSTVSRGRMNILADQVRNAYLQEERIGIARERDTHAARDQYLYQASHYRMPDAKHGNVHDTYGLWIGVMNDADLFPDRGVMALGGEGRQAEITQIPDLNLPWNSDEIVEVVKASIISTGRFRLYLLTPGLFQRNDKCTAYPNAVSDRKLDLGNGVSADLISACLVQNTVHFGGWDIKNRWHKPLQRAVPAGSVYFFQINDWKAKSDNVHQDFAHSIMKKFHGTCALEGDDPAGKEGFGLTLVGGW